MEIMITAAFAVIGAAIGSFLNVCIDRLSRGESPAYPASHCDACGHALAPGDLIPVVSYLRLGGRCRYCQARISPRVPWVEAGTGLLFAFLYWHYRFSAGLAVSAFYSCVFIVILFIDLEHRIIPNKVIYPAAVAALAIDVFLPPGIVWGAIGAAAGFIFLLVPALIKPEGMGFGDVKMAALMGLVLGFPLVMVSLVMGAALGGVLGLGLILLKLKTRKDTIPFGPFLSVATIVTLLWGDRILAWYLSFYKF